MATGISTAGSGPSHGVGRSHALPTGSHGLWDRRLDLGPRREASRHGRLEAGIRFLTAMVLWGISASLTFELFLSLGDGTHGRTILLGLSAVALEGAKILCWRRGGPARLLAVALIGLSALASLFAALETVEAARSRFSASSLAGIRASATYQAASQEAASLDAEIEAGIARLRTLPPDFITASLNLSASIERLRTERRAAAANLARMEGDAKQDRGSFSDGLAILARTFGIRPDAILLALLCLVSAAIEAGALVLSLPENPPREAPRRPTAASEPGRRGNVQDSGEKPVPPPWEASVGEQRPQVTPEEFLAAAVRLSDTPGYLAGRDKTSLTLGLTYRDGKRLVHTLTERGRIRVEGRRLRLVETDSA
jgi:hypothetical protein